MQQNIISIRSPKTSKTYKLKWDKPTPPNDSDIDDFLNEMESGGIDKPPVATPESTLIPPRMVQDKPQTTERYGWDTSLSRFGKALGERLLDLGDMVVNPVEHVKEQVQNYQLGQTIKAVNATPKPTGPKPPLKNEDVIGAIASFAGIPVEKIQEGNYSGALGEALPDVALAIGGARAGKIAKAPSYLKTQLSKIAEERLSGESRWPIGAPPKPKPVEPVKVTLVDPTKEQLGGYLDKGFAVADATNVRGTPRFHLEGDADLVKPVQSIATPTVPVEPVSLVKKLTTEIGAARKIRGKQDTLVSAERGRRFANAKAVGEATTGPEGLKKELSELGGKLPKVSFESLEGKFSPQERTALHEIIKQKLPDYTDNLRARTGLDKLFGDFGGEIPQPKELELLEKALGSDVTGAILKHRSLGDKTRSVITKILGTSKTARTTIDLSFPLRQGLPYIGNKEFHKSIIPMIKSAFNPKYFEERQLTIRHRPLYHLGEEAGLDLTDMGTKREEQFVNNYLEKNFFTERNVPVLSPIAKKVAGVVKGSNRAYVSFANDLRSSLFDNMIKDTTNITGKKVTPDQAKKIARYINVTTGRGSLGNFEVAASDLNAALFSPRLLSSRIEMMTNPMLYLNSGAAVRRQALKSALAMSSFIGGTAGAAALAGADVNLNPNDSDFMKIKMGNTRLDLGGGFLQPVRLIHQLVSGKYVDSSGTEKDLGNEFFSPDRASLVGNFLANKMSPAASTTLDLLQSKEKNGQRVNKYGEPLTSGHIAKDLFLPMVMEDLGELLKEDPSLLYLLGPSVLGGGVQVQKPKKVRAIR